MKCKVVCWFKFYTELIEKSIILKIIPEMRKKYNDQMKM